MQEQISKERFNKMISKYNKFIENLDSINLEPIKVFEPLNAKQLEELYLIRDISKYLQKKKDDEEAAKAAKADVNVDDQKETAESEDSKTAETDE